MLDLVDARLPRTAVIEFLREWHTSVPELSDESKWVSLAFVEAFCGWLAGQVGTEPMVQKYTTDQVSPRALGFLYGVMRAVGSPRLLYSRLPEYLPLVNKVSAVRVSGLRRGQATIEYRPKEPRFQERSRLICQLRRAQLAAVPGLWGLPPATIEELECQQLGAERCLYELHWVEPAEWPKVATCGALAGAAGAAMGSGLWAALAAGAGLLLATIWRGGVKALELKRLAAAQSQTLKEAAEMAERRFLELEAASALDAASSPQSTLVLPEVARRQLPSASTAIEPNVTLAARYLVGELLGRGGMANVWRATDRETNRAIAIKVLKPELAADPRWIARLQREVALARRIQHPNVCRVFDVVRSGVDVFVTMELATRGSLRRLLEAGVTRSWQERVADVRAVVAGLAAVHQAGLVHRDLTPQNLLRMDDNRLVVADFGLATDPAQTTAVVGGTPLYVPPEVALGARPSFAADVWQLGVVMHEVLFGARPTWEERSDSRSPRWPVGSQAAAVERAFAGVCVRCLADRPSARPQAAWVVWHEILAAERMAHASRRWSVRPLRQTGT